MRRAVFLSIAVTAAIGFAQQYTEFSAWMKSTDTATKAVNRMGNKTGPEAVRAAETLGGVYENMIGFWRQRNAPDAVKWSEEGKAAAVQFASAANGGNADAAAAAFKTLGGTCRPCHDAYRVRLAGGKFAFRFDAGDRKRPPAGKKQ
jgi:hypothetical protein